MAQDPAVEESIEEGRKHIIDDILKNEAMCEESRKIIQDPNVVFIIRRSKNQNIVVYRANMTKDGQIDENDPVSVFWLKIEPSYVEKNRNSGKKDDKQELTFLENNMAYGIYQEKMDEKCKETGQTQYKITFVAFKQRPAILKLNKKGQPRCFGTIEDIPAYLVAMYASTTENWIGLPTVNYVLMTGTRVDNEKKIEEKMTP